MCDADGRRRVRRACTPWPRAAAARPPIERPLRPQRERDEYKSQAESARQHAVRCKDRIEELAYRVNGLAAGAL